MINYIRARIFRLVYEHYLLSTKNTAIIKTNAQTFNSFTTVYDHVLFIDLFNWQNRLTIMLDKLIDNCYYFIIINIIFMINLLILFDMVIFFEVVQIFINCY